MKKTLLLIGTVLSSLTNMAYADENFDVNKDYNIASQDINNIEATPVKEEIKNVKISVTQKTFNKYHEVPHSIFEYIQNTAKQNGYTVLWMPSENGSTITTSKLNDDFYKDNERSWKEKIAKSLEEYNQLLYHSEARGTNVYGYVCDNNKIVVSNNKDTAKLYKHNKISNCQLMVSTEEVKTYINGKEIDADRALEKQINEEQNKMKEKIEKEAEIKSMIENQIDKQAEEIKEELNKTEEATSTNEQH